MNKIRNRDMYFSIDIESDGSAPGTSSMLSIAVVALDPVDLTECGTFYRTLKRLPEARPENDTMNWWDGFPEQWVQARKDPQDPAEVMRALQEFVIEMGKQAKRRHNMFWGLEDFVLWFSEEMHDVEGRHGFKQVWVRGEWAGTQASLAEIHEVFTS